MNGHKKSCRCVACSPATRRKGQRAPRKPRERKVVALAGHVHATKVVLNDGTVLIRDADGRWSPQ